MTGPPHLLPFVEAAIQLATQAFDKGLYYQLEAKDDATLAIWAGVGLETITVWAVASTSPAQAFVGDEVPDATSLSSLHFQTKRLTELISLTSDLYPTTQFPPIASTFVREIRHKLLHLNTAAHAGLVGPTLRLIQQLAEWLSGIDLPPIPIHSPPRVLHMHQVDELPTALRAAVSHVAADNVEHLEYSLERGLWDDRPDLKEVAVRELEECRELV